MAHIVAIYWKQTEDHTPQYFTLMGKLCGANTLRPRQNGHHFADDTFKLIFMNENVRISTNISFKFVPKGLINNIPALVQIMAWHRPGDKPLSEPMMVNLLTHLCITWPQWVNCEQVNNFTWPSWHFKSPATWQFIQQLLQANIKGTTKVLHCWYSVRR